MFYGQKNYGQELGNGGFTIAAAGCFLTSFSNLLSEYGITMDPSTLNTWFRGHGVYLKDADGALEDLAWNSITKYAPNIVVTATGSGPVPPNTPAIVKFHYNSVHTGQPIDHFCLVSKVVNGQVYIIDSYDGLEKAPAGYEAVYHKPIEWATYVDNAVPAPAPAPAPAPPAPTPTKFAPNVPIPGNTDNTYDIVVPVPGYRTSGFAAGRSNPTVTVEPGKYYVYNKFVNMVNVTKVPGKPGAWINPGDNVAPAPVTLEPAKFNVTQTIPGYLTSNDAANHINQTVHVGAGDYFVYNEAHGMVNVSVKQGQAGAWINPADLTAQAAPAPAPAAPAPAAVTASSDQHVEVPAAPASLTSEDWLNAFKNSFDAKSEIYLALVGGAIADKSGKKSPVQLHKYDTVPSAGTFTGPDGQTYSVSPTSVKNGWLYAIPINKLTPEGEMFGVPVKEVKSLRQRVIDAINKIAIFFENKKTAKETK